MNDNPEYPRSRLFDGVDEAEVRELLGGCELVKLQAGELLLSPDMDNFNLYYLLEGQMSIHLGNINNPALDTFTPGECAGELSFLDGKRPSGYVVVDEPSEAYVIDADVLTGLVGASHVISLNLIHILTSRMRFGLVKINDTFEDYLEQQRQANTDSLTGLYNRRWLDKMFLREYLECHENKKPSCLLMIDIDNFKPYNDSNGHLSGDKALCTVADVLRKSIRYTDLIARYGGEEFSIFLPSTSHNEGVRIAQSICDAVASTEIYDDSQQRLPSVTISIGLAVDRDDKNYDDLVADADAALYKAKDAGRNCVME